MNLPDRNYATLDALAVIGSLVIVAGIVAGLFIFKLDPAVAPIVSALATAILGIPVSYGAFRWGSSVGAKNAQQQTSPTAARAADQVAQAAAEEAETVREPKP